MLTFHRQRQHILYGTTFYRIFLIALDAAKTGASLIENRDLLRVKKPHYMADTDSIVSDSVVGRLYDMVKGTCEHLSLCGFDTIILYEDANIGHIPM